MDKLVRKIEIPLARKAIEKAGLYIVQEKDLDHVRVTLETIREVLAGELTLEDLREKYAEMDKQKQEQH